MVVGWSKFSGICLTSSATSLPAKSSGVNCVSLPGAGFVRTKDHVTSNYRPFYIFCSIVLPQCHSVMEHRQTSPSMCLPPCFLFTATSVFFQDADRKAANTRVIFQAFAMPRKGLKKTMDEAQAQFNSMFSYSPGYLLIPFSFSFFFFYNYPSFPSVLLTTIPFFRS